MTLPPEISSLLDRTARHLHGEELASFVDDALTPQERRRVSGHLAECAHCRRLATEVRSALAADRANPVRLEQAAARIVAAQHAAIRVSPGSGNGVASEGDAEANAKANAAGRFVRTLVEQAKGWAGSIGKPPWKLQPAVAGLPLAAGKPSYAGARSDLEHLFDRDVLDNGLRWAVGPLVLGVAYEASGELRSIRAAVGVRSGDTSGLPMTLTLSGREGGTSCLTLTPERPSDVLNAPCIRGCLEDLRLQLSLEGESK